MSKNKFKRIVVKVGTSSITDASGKLDEEQIKNIAAQLALVLKDKVEIVVVSSGAIAAGIDNIGFAKRPTEISELQAAASVGQNLLVNMWGNSFNLHGITVGQVLLTQNDFIHREQYLNARNALNKLLELKIVPVINENDATSVEEIRLGDNDVLAAMLSTLIEADLLLMITDTAFLYKEINGEKEIIEVVEKMTPEIMALGGGTGSKFASGGMATKLQAANIATNFGISCGIADGRQENSIEKFIRGESVGTVFKPKERKVKGRRAWIAFGRLSKGQLTIDDGAMNALVNQGRSLLAAGIVGVEGAFHLGDTVDIADANGHVLAKGLTNYSNAEVERIKGLKTVDISQLYGEDFSEEVIHRDSLVLL